MFLLSCAQPSWLYPISCAQPSWLYLIRINYDVPRNTEFMAYSIHGQISSRQKIELGILGPSVIKPSCSVYSSACSEYAGTNSSFGRNYWGKYGPFVLFAITVNKSVAFIFLITCFLPHEHMYSLSTLSKFQVIYPTRSWVIGD